MFKPSKSGLPPLVTTVDGIPESENIGHRQRTQLTRSERAGVALGGAMLAALGIVGVAHFGFREIGGDVPVATSLEAIVFVGATVTEAVAITGKL